MATEEKSIGGNRYEEKTKNHGIANRSFSDDFS